MSTQRTEQDFVICDVTETETGWDIHLGPHANDPWVSVSAKDFVAPEPGDIATVVLPRVLAIVSPA